MFQIYRKQDEIELLNSSTVQVDWYTFLFVVLSTLPTILKGVLVFNRANSKIMTFIAFILFFKFQTAFKVTFKFHHYLSGSF